MGIIYRISLVLVIIGAINWGLIGLFNFDLVATLFGGQETALSRIVYGLVGLAGLLCIPLLFRELKDDEVELADNRHSNAYTNMNYQTEFGEEPDFTKEERERALENYNNDGKDNKEDKNKNDLV